MNYYSEEINKIICRPTGTYPCAVFKLQDENGSTKWLNINQESVDALAQYFRTNGFNIN